jgi:hypothetical protein
MREKNSSDAAHILRERFFLIDAPGASMDTAAPGTAHAVKQPQTQKCPMQGKSNPDRINAEG